MAVLPPSTTVNRLSSVMLEAIFGIDPDHRSYRAVIYDNGDLPADVPAGVFGRYRIYLPKWCFGNWWWSFIHGL